MNPWRIASLKRGKGYEYKSVEDALGGTLDILEEQRKNISFKIEVGLTCGWSAGRSPSKNYTIYLAHASMGRDIGYLTPEQGAKMYDRMREISDYIIAGSSQIAADRIKSAAEYLVACARDHIDNELHAKYSDRGVISPSQKAIPLSPSYAARKKYVFHADDNPILKLTGQLYESLSPYYKFKRI